MFSCAREQEGGEREELKIEKDSIREQTDGQKQGTPFVKGRDVQMMIQ